MNEELKQELAVKALCNALSKHPPFQTVRRLRDDEVEALKGATIPFAPGVKPRVQKAILKAITRRLERIEKRRDADAKLFDRFYAWIDAKVRAGGAWVHALAHDAKGIFPSAYATKSRVISAVRRNPELTMREQPYGDSPGDTAPAVFRGKPVPHEAHEDQPLPI